MDKKQKLKGMSPYNDKADNYNIDIDSIMTEDKTISDRNRLINYKILAFVKMYDFAKTRSDFDYKEAKRYLNVVMDLESK